VNFFQPSFKLASKTRLGAKVRKTYHLPETPYAKLLASAAVPDEMKDRLRTVADRASWRRSAWCNTTWRDSRPASRHI